MDRMLGPFKVLAYYGYLYRLKLPESIKNYSVFNVKVLKKNLNNPLPKQVNPPPKPIVVNNQDK